MMLFYMFSISVVWAWTITFDTHACTNGFATDDESMDTATISRNSSCGANGVTAVSCVLPTGGVGGPFITNPSNGNFSIEINFTAQHPVPNVTTLFSTAPPPTGAFDINRGYYGGMSLVMVNNYIPEDPDLLDGWVASHFFALYSPAVLSRTGYCDTVSATTQLLFFNDATFQTMMQDMREGTGESYSVRAMFVHEDSGLIMYVRLRNANSEGWAFSPTNLSFGTVYSSGYALRNGTSFYVGCGPEIPYSSPGVTIARIEINQEVYIPQI